MRGALIQMGPHKIDRAHWDWNEVSKNPFFCPDAQQAKFFEDYLDGVRKAGSSVGAVIEVVAEGVPAGLGAPVYAKLDADLGRRADGHQRGQGRGDRRRFCHRGDERRGQCRRDARMGNDRKPVFLSNHAGGILGGISSGQPIVARFAVKPTSSILTPRKTVDRYGRDTEVVDQRPPRSLRRHPRRADRRGHGGMRAGRSLSHASRPDGRGNGVAVLATRLMSSRVNPVSDSHSRVDAAIKAFAKGEIVVVTDDDDRENEGDLFVAASLCTPEKMAFIIRNTSGIVCAPLGAEHARRLHLDPMVARTRRRSAPPSPSRSMCATG